MGVSIDAAVVITFSEVINASTLSYNVTPDPGGWSAAWAASSQWVTLTHAAFAENTRYTVTVTIADDLVGNPLADAPVMWWFETAGADAIKVYLPLVMRDE